MGLIDPDLPVHLKDATDGYPPCWMDLYQELFESSWNEADVTCQDCINYLKG
jgi:hypothetical protein